MAPREFCAVHCWISRAASGRVVTRRSPITIRNASPRVSWRAAIAIWIAGSSRALWSKRASAPAIVRVSACWFRWLGALQALQARTLGIRGGLLEDQRVTGRECFDLREGQRGVADVLHFTDVEAATHDL